MYTRIILLTKNNLLLADTYVHMFVSDVVYKLTHLFMEFNIQFFSQNICEILNKYTNPLLTKLE